MSVKHENSMLPWITTKQFTVDLMPKWSKSEGDKDWSLGAISADIGDAQRRIEAIVAELNADQWEIKMVVPLSKSLTYHEHQKIVRSGKRKDPEEVLGAFGLGWAGDATAALLIVAQRTEWIDSADYKKRMAARNDADALAKRARERAEALEHNAAINAKIAEIERQLSRFKGMNVEGRKSGFLRGEKFIVAGKDYASRQDAESARKSKVAELERELEHLPQQLRIVIDDEPRRL